jgi:hypothetical protein
VLQRVAPAIVATKEPSPLAVARANRAPAETRTRSRAWKCLPVILSGADALTLSEGFDAEVDRVNAVNPTARASTIAPSAMSRALRIGFEYAQENRGSSRPVRDMHEDLFVAPALLA